MFLQKGQTYSQFFHYVPDSGVAENLWSGSRGMGQLRVSAICNAQWPRGTPIIILKQKTKLAGNIVASMHQGPHFNPKHSALSEESLICSPSAHLGFLLVLQFPSTTPKTSLLVDSLL